MVEEDVAGALEEVVEFLACLEDGEARLFEMGWEVVGFQQLPSHVQSIVVLLAVLLVVLDSKPLSLPLLYEERQNLHRTIIQFHLMISLF